VQPPRLLKEQAAIRRNYLLTGQDVGECRDVAPIGVAALSRLVELLRIANQNDRLCCV
jgi:hypothetical protein